MSGSIRSTEPGSGADAVFEGATRPPARATSASAIFATGSTSSTAPVAIALRGIPSYSASYGSCAMARPPPSLTAFSPRLPSEPVPDSTTPMARGP